MTWSTGFKVNIDVDQKVNEVMEAMKKHLKCPKTWFYVVAKTLMMFFSCKEAHLYSNQSENVNNCMCMDVQSCMNGRHVHDEHSRVPVKV